MDNKYIFQHVDINSIQFVNNKNDVRFEFYNCTSESGCYRGSLTCINVSSFEMRTNFDDDEDTCFPQYVLDVYEEPTKQGNSLIKIWLQGSPYDICIVCKEILVEKT